MKVTGAALHKGQSYTYDLEYDEKPSDKNPFKGKVSSLNIQIDGHTIVRYSKNCYLPAKTSAEFMLVSQLLDKYN